MPRKRKTTNYYREKDLQKFCNDYLKINNLTYLRIPDSLFFMLRAQNKFAYLKMLTGFPDNIVFAKSPIDGICYALMLELKTPKGKLRDSQDSFWKICRTPDEIVNAINIFIDFVKKQKQQ